MEAIFNSDLDDFKVYALSFYSIPPFMFLEKEMATHSSILAWEIPQTESLVGYSPWVARVGHDLAIKTPSPPPPFMFCDPK